MAQRWYAIRTEPRAEYVAAKELERDGYEVFFPRIKAAYPRVGHDDIPLFPGYMFLRCDPEMDGWPSFRSGHRVYGWLNFGGDVASLPETDVIELKARVDNINSHGGVWRRYLPGELVRVLAHGMANVAEVVEEPKSPHWRVKVLLEFMGRLVSAQVGWQDVSPINETTARMSSAHRRTRGKGRWIRGFGSRAGETA